VIEYRYASDPVFYLIVVKETLIVPCRRHRNMCIHHDIDNSSVSFFTSGIQLSLIRPSPSRDASALPGSRSFRTEVSGLILKTSLVHLPLPDPREHHGLDWRRRGFIRYYIFLYITGVDDKHPNLNLTPNPNTSSQDMLFWTATHRPKKNFMACLRPHLPVTLHRRTYTKCTYT
jgi:hypothetical protein